MSVAAPPGATSQTGTGTRRHEDTRLLCGQGQFLGDVQRPDLKHIAILRSPLAHARIRDVDVSGAMTLPGVIGVFTGAELAAETGEFSHHLPRIRVVAPDMGGGFGNKAHFMREESLVAVLAMRVRHPVVWQQDRTENLLSGLHSREQVHEVEVAYRNDGRVLGLRANFVVDVGSPELYILGCAPAIVTTSVVPNCYDLQDYAYELRCVATNKCPMGGYRGYGQPQGIFLMERVLDLLGERLGIDPVAIRRLNMIPDESRPYVTATGAVLDIGGFDDQLSALLEAAEYEAACGARDEARAEGRLIGVGIAQMVEPTAPSPRHWGRRSSRSSITTATASRRRPRFWTT